MKDKPIKNIWMISREYGDLAGAGGVKDVAQQLAEALARWSGRKVRMVLPMYGSIDPEKHGFTLLADPGQPEQALEFMIDLNYDMQERREFCRVWTKRQNRVDLYLIAADRFREKYGVYTYTEQDVQLTSQHQRGLGHIDYFAMNILLQKSSLELMVLLGERDTDPAHPQLPRASQAMAQGRHRLERGQMFFQTGRDEAASLGTPFRWELHTVPGIAHSDTGMATAAVALMFDAPKRGNRSKDKPPPARDR